MGTNMHTSTIERARMQARAQASKCRHAHRADCVSRRNVGMYSPLRMRLCLWSLPMLPLRLQADGRLGIFGRGSKAAGFYYGRKACARLNTSCMGGGRVRAIN
eukprot:6177446-Pleurochrysis_carterae.AAC.2